MTFRIVSLREAPLLADCAALWFASKWNLPPEDFRRRVSGNRSGSGLPQWFLALDETDGILGGCGLVEEGIGGQHEFSPYLCALYVEEASRGNQIGRELLWRARTAAAEAGACALYLCSDLVGYYERYGWEWIGYGGLADGSFFRLYRASAAPAETDV